MGMLSRIGGLFSGPARTAPQQRSFAAARVDRLTSGWLNRALSGMPEPGPSAPEQGIAIGLDLPLLEGEILAETFRERVLRTEDAHEGPLAFVEKRAPNWQCR